MFRRRENSIESEERAKELKKNTRSNIESKKGDKYIYYKQKEKEFEGGQGEKCERTKRAVRRERTARETGRDMKGERVYQDKRTQG